MAFQINTTSSAECCRQHYAKQPSLLESGKLFWSGMFSKFVKAVRLRRERKRNRDAFQHMLGLDDALLRDIGVTREDVIWANNLPLEINAAVELQKQRKQRIKKV